MVDNLFKLWCVNRKSLPCCAKQVGYSLNEDQGKRVTVICTLCFFPIGSSDIDALVQVCDVSAIRTRMLKSIIGKYMNTSVTNSGVRTPINTPPRTSYVQCRITIDRQVSSATQIVQHFVWKSISVNRWMVYISLLDPAAVMR